MHTIIYLTAGCTPLVAILMEIILSSRLLTPIVGFCDVDTVKFVATVSTMVHFIILVGSHRVSLAPVMSTGNASFDVRYFNVLRDY